jgi:hypothetical protein
MRVDIVYDDALPIDFEHHRRHDRANYTLDPAVMHAQRTQQKRHVSRGGLALEPYPATHSKLSVSPAGRNERAAPCST